MNVGDFIEAGDNITKGPLDPKDLLRLRGAEGVYQYLIKEVQRVYKTQGVDINDKHIEVIVSQMLSKYKIEDSGDTNLLPEAGCRRGYRPRPATTFPKCGWRGRLRW